MRRSELLPAQRASPRRGGGQGGAARAPRHHVRRPGQGRAVSGPPHRTPHSGRPVCASALRAVPPAGEAGSDSPVRSPRAGAGPCCCRCWFCRRRASGTGLAIPVPVRPPRRYVKCGGNGAESPRAAPWPGARPAAPGGAGALTCRALPALPPQRRLAGARPAATWAAPAFPEPRGAEGTPRFGSSTEGRRCSERCRFVPSVLQSDPFGLSSAARSDHAV